jgi:D-serine deaminase-like pyridoxal phosphate-dependent protein
MLIEDLKTPALLLDRNRLEDNIDQMAKKAKTNRVRLKPHIKTHKCPEVAELQLSAGAQGITVSTVWEAAAFADSGFDDITLAVPIVRDKVEFVVGLANDMNLTLLVDSRGPVGWLKEEALKQQTRIGMLIKVDCGYHRCGVDPDTRELVEIAEMIENAEWLDFRGILTHAGHAYDAKSVQDIRVIAEQEQLAMSRAAEQLARHSLKPAVLSIGSTPTMSLTPSIRDEITEIRPGNYVFYDYDQVALGSCSFSDCALTVLASVIGNYGDRIVVDAGATALSKDLGPVHIDPENGYGRVFADRAIREPTGDRIVSVSQEHGKIQLEDDSPLRHIEPGDRIHILSNHSCLTANLFSQFYVHDGGERVLDRWRIMHKRHRTIMTERY